ncbi:MAG TPA: NAD(P)H-dependent oxidoreductase, partial [Bacilli bacterium]|nr:NAD(P)H-dependent oxidoreductase [Bacilli bacterium]
MTKIGIIISSLRENSNSQKIANNLLTLLEGKADAKVIDIKALPLYNQDLDKEGETPESYTTFRNEVKSVNKLIVI